MLNRHQIVGLQGAPGRHQVDDGVRQSGQRCQLHGSVKFDQIDMDALGREVLARNVDVLCRHFEARALPDSPLVVETRGNGHHHPAFGDTQIKRLIEPIATILDQHILAGDTDVRSAILHIGRCVGGTHDNHTNVVAIGRDDQLAGGLRILQRLNAGGSQQRQRFFEYSTLR